MDNEAIDAIFAEASVQDAPVQEAVATDETVQPPQVDKEKANWEELKDKPDSELTPEQLEKRQRNRESHERSKIAESKRRIRELEAQLAQAQQPPKPVEAVKPEGEPQLDQFETWEEYNRALIKHEAKQLQESHNKQTQEAQKTQEFNKWAEERSQRVDTRITELSDAIPDLNDILEEIDDAVGGKLPPELARIALEADDINLAAYTLWKEGKFAELLKMSPSQAAMAIAKAEIRGQAYLSQPKPTTNAPAPLSPSRGSSNGGKSLDKMSADELYDWVKGKK